MSPLLGQIIRLIKSIQLRPPEPSRRPTSQFIAGRHPPFGFPPGIGLSWWYDGDTFLARDAVAAMIISESSAFVDCDLETASDVVIKSLHEVCVDNTIFNEDAVVFARRQTLFDCVSMSIPQCATAIRGVIEAKLRARIGRCCTIHVVPRIKPASFHLQDVGIHVIAKWDRDAWQRLVDEEFLFDGWTPEDPQVGLRRDALFAPTGHFDAVLVADGYGTQKGAWFGSVLKFRMLLAVIFAVASERAPYPYLRSGASPSEFCVQFPHATHPAKTLTRNGCGPLIPYYIDDICIGANEVSAIQNWYVKFSVCSSTTKNRIEKAAYFLNLGMNANDTEAYVNYFVTLDALLGQRGAVETSILSGLRMLGLDVKLIEKARWLFDLRNDIVHGGSRYIEEWSEHTRYTRHFRTQPMRDIQTLAQLSVLRAPHMLT